MKPTTTAEIPGERWRPVPGLDDWYDVSDHGRLRSWCTSVPGRRAAVPRILPGTVNGEGYLVVCIRGGTMACIHRLVAMAWVPVPPDVGEAPEACLVDACGGSEPGNIVWREHARLRHGRRRRAGHHRA